MRVRHCSHTRAALVVLSVDIFEGAAGLQVAEPVQQAVTQIVDVVIDQINWASLAYNIYALLFVVFPSPMVLHRPSLRSRLSGFAYLSKYMSVMIVVIVWNIVLVRSLMPFCVCCLRHESYQHSKSLCQKLQGWGRQNLLACTACS